MGSVSGIAMSYGVRRTQLRSCWLWHKPTATALIQPLTWELPYATCAALKKKKKCFYIQYFQQEWALNL